MIPYGIFACEFHGKQNIEVRALELAPDYFTFRMDNDLNPQTYNGATLHFYRFEESRYVDLELSDYEILPLKECEFYWVYKMIIPEEQYYEMAVSLMKEYGRYIELKLEAEERIVSQELTGYPAEKELEFSESFDKQKKRWLGDSLKTNQLFFTKEQIFGISIDRPDLWEQYIRDGYDIMIHNYFESYGITLSESESSHIRYLYIGNQFCPLLQPSEQELLNLFHRVVEEGRIPVWVLSFVRESMLETLKHRLEILRRWFDENRIWIREQTGMDSLEIVVNDWGTLELLREYAREIPLSITLGTLLSKRRKDTRLSYKKGYQYAEADIRKSTLEEVCFVNSLSDEFQSMNISYESCEYENAINEKYRGTTTMFFPFYQMNTSSFCTLSAYLETGNRGHQSENLTCPGYCRDHVFLYPDM